MIKRFTDSGGMSACAAFKLAALLAGLIATPLAAAARLPSRIAAAVASPARTADNVKLDESRKPAEVLSFLGLQPGMSVLDLFGANRYWAEIMAPVVGPKGHVTVWEPTQFYNDEAQAAFEAFEAKNPERLARSRRRSRRRHCRRTRRLRDAQPQLSRHLLAKRQVRHSADGPGRVAQDASMRR